MTPEIPESDAIAPQEAAAAAGDDPFDPGSAPAEALLGRALRRGRLRLAGLSLPARVLAALVLLALVVAGGLMLATALGLALPGGVIEIPGPFVDLPEPLAVPTVAMLAILAAAAVLGAAAVASVLLVPRRRTRWVVLAVAAASASIAAQVAGYRGAAESVAELDPAAAPILTVATAVALLAAAILALGAILSPRSRLVRLAPAFAGLAAVPPAALAVALLAGFGAAIEIPDAAAAGLDGFPATLRLVPAAVAAPLATSLLWLVPTLLAPFALWQGMTWSRASRDVVGLRVAGAVEPRVWLLAGLLAAKGTWLVLGYAGLLPAVLGGAGDGWAASRANGPAAWLLAAGYAAAIGVVLAWGRLPRLRDRDLGPGAAYFVVGFSIVAVVAAALLLAAGLLTLLPDSAAAEALLAAVDRATDAILLVQLLTVVAAPLAGLALIRAGRRGAGLLVLAVAAWAAPTAVGVARLLLGLDGPDDPWPFRVELATLDTTVTIAIAAVALVGLVRGRGSLNPRQAAALALVLVVATLVGQGGSLAPVAIAGVLAAIALLFPAAYELLFESARLNEPGPTRTARVLAALAGRGAAVWLVVAGLLVAGGTPSTGAEQLARALFAPGYAALVTVVALGAAAWRRGGAGAGVKAEAADGGAAPARRLPAPAAALAGAATVLALAVAGTLVADPMLARVATAAGLVASPAEPSPTPTPTATPAPTPATDAQAFAAFQAALVARTEDAAQRITVGLAAAGASGDTEALLAAAAGLRAGAAADLAWIAGEDIRACYVPLAEAYAGTIDAEDRLGAALQAWVGGTGPEEEAIAAITAYDVASQKLEPALVDGARACGLVTPSGAPSPSPSPSG